MKSCSIFYRVCACYIHYLPRSHIVAVSSDKLSWYHSTFLQVTQVNLNSSRKAGNLDLPEKSHKGLPLRER
jgi:hypothetical protein